MCVCTYIEHLLAGREKQQRNELCLKSARVQRRPALCTLVYACVCLCMFVYGLLALQGFCVILALTDVCISDIDTCEFAKQKLWQRWYVGDIHIDSRESFLKRQR